MPVSKPVLGEQGWGTTLNAALDTLETEKLAVTTASGTYSTILPDAADANGRRVPPANHLVRYLPNTAPAVPPGMSWLPFTVLGRTPDGKVALSKTPQQVLDAIATLANASTSPVYIDATIGDDAGVGTNPGQPHKTLSPGVALGVYRHYVAAGEYPDVIDLRSDAISGNRVRRFYGAANPVGQADFLDPSKYTILRATGDQPNALTWTLLGGGLTYQATLPGTNIPARVLVSLRRDALGRPVPLPKQPDVASIGTAGWGWHFDAATRVLSVRYGSMADAATFTSTLAPKLSIIYRQPANYYARMFGGQAYFENVVFCGVYAWLLADATRTAPRAVFKNCVFAYSDGGAVVIDGGRAALVDCEFYRCFGDGVGSHVAAGFQADHMIVNALSRYVGDTDTYGVAGTQNKNHAAMHESGRAFIAGLDGRESFGPGLIDTGETAGTGVSWWYGNNIGDSFGVNPNYEVGTGARTVWMDQCAENGDTQAAPRSSGASTVLRYGANATRTPVATSTGAAVAFDPKLPV